MSKLAAAAKNPGKIALVMGEFKQGQLHSGSDKGPIVTNPKQGIAIAISEAKKHASGNNQDGQSHG